ncbi:carbohydrate ABC transporter permease [Metabacillus rhizolycopersici]|uniref:Sugar ABC transporter permease n=1 Tax=Metabacillus rhizolycopersici TaxID=2875709 RepID=A0ABS7UV33_9BACI|nr:sugar ABC transporter permease [Metabacillus rhizolycopersici]MBZ5752168.1 sugar ABC transporter permease [Metabacillus rhizolycopersici]
MSVPYVEKEKNLDIPKETKAKKKKSSDVRAAFWFLLPNLTGFLTFTFIPIIATFVLSLFEWSLISEPKFVGFDNYINLFSKDTVFGSVIFNTFFYVIVYVVLNLIVSVGFAVWLNQKIKGIKIYRAFLFLPVLVSPVAIAMVWQWMYEPQNGLINEMLQWIGIQGPNWLGDSKWAMIALILMCVWQNFGYNMIIFLAALQGVPQSMLEAASIDGAGPFVRFFKIMLPAISPAIFFGTVMTLINAFQVFDQAYVLTNGGPGNATEVLGLYIYKNAFQWFEMGKGAAIAVIMFGFILIITLLQLVLQKKWVHYETK